MSSPESRLRELQEKQWAWSSKAFPDQTREGVIKHAQKELDEVKDAPNDIVEKADALMLFLCTCSHDGHHIGDVIKAAFEKLEVCKTRDWKRNPEGSYDHIEKPYNEADWVPLREGDIWRNGDIFTDPVSPELPYVIGTHQRWGGVSRELNTAPIEGQAVSKTFEKFSPRRRRAIPMGDE